MFSCLQILEAFLWFVLITLLNVTLIILTLSVSRLLNLDRKSGSAGMPRPISYAVFCLKKKTKKAPLVQLPWGSLNIGEKESPPPQYSLFVHYNLFTNGNEDTISHD